MRSWQRLVVGTIAMFIVGGASIGLNTVAGQAATTGGGRFVLPSVPFGGKQDVVFRAVLTGGLAGIPSQDDAMVDIFLFDGAAGAPLQSVTGGTVCDPCVLALNPAQRSGALSVRAEGERAGGLGTGTAFAIVVVTGAGADTVSVAAHHLPKFSKPSVFEELDIAPVVA
jgi:hypothetical protein